MSHRTGVRLRRSAGPSQPLGLCQHGERGSVIRKIAAAACLALLLATQPAAPTAAQTTTYGSTLGPGIAPPASVRTGLPGYQQAAFTVGPMEDDGIFSLVAVLDPDGSAPPEPPALAQVAYSTSTVAAASWYGPGFYGNRTACGLTLTTSLPGVAHRSLPCGADVTLRYNETTVTVPVVDRGPFVYDREFDLTYATRVAFGCPDICILEWLR